MRVPRGHRFVPVGIFLEAGGCLHCTLLVGVLSLSSEMEEQRKSFQIFYKESGESGQDTVVVGFSSEGFTSLAIKKVIQESGPRWLLAVCWRDWGFLVEAVSSRRVRVGDGCVADRLGQSEWVSCSSPVPRVLGV